MASSARSDVRRLASASPRSRPKPEPEAPKSPQSVSSVRGRTMSSVLCVLSVLTNVAVRVDSVIHQSGNCELPRTQEAKKWNEMKIIDPGDHRDVTRAFLDLCVSSLRRGHVYLDFRRSNLRHTKALCTSRALYRSNLRWGKGVKVALK